MHHETERITDKIGKCFDNIDGAVLLSAIAAVIIGKSELADDATDQADFAHA